MHVATHLVLCDYACSYTPGVVRTWTLKVALSCSSLPRPAMQLYCPASSLPTLHSSRNDLMRVNVSPLLEFTAVVLWMIMLEPFFSTVSPFFQLSVRGDPEPSSSAESA